MLAPYTQQQEQEQEQEQEQREEDTVERQDLAQPFFIPPQISAMLDMLLAAHYAEPSVTTALQTLQKHWSDPQMRLHFDGQILFVSSASEPNRVHQTDGAQCQCRGKNHARCWHRLLHHKLTLYSALVDPAWLTSAEEREGQ